jgi:serine/threonine protein phosphatase PrpC
MIPDPTASAAGIRVAFRSDRGRVRANNEDLPIVDVERGVYGVIDGVGGHAAGELAAAIASDVIMQRLARPLGTPAERVREAIALANNEIFRRAEAAPDLHGMTCVVTLAVMTDGGLTIGHVGDTRLYKLHLGGMRKLTRDHSPVGEREDAREISEAEAMRHPRRHEVFRDVGGAHRDKDEQDYVDVLQEPIERDSAILLCTDGLSDMLPSAEIERLARLHAGQPDAVVDALVQAANEAGGKDNITVVYVEGPDFARAMGSRSATLTPALPAASGGSRRRWLEPARWVLRSRTTWFAAGAGLGVLSALALIWYVPAANAVGSRLLVVGPPGQGAFTRMTDAVANSGPGDTIRVEPGTYAEQVYLPDGVSLVARIPGSVTLTRAAGWSGEWIAITAVGDRGSRISGIRIESTAERIIGIGLLVAGQGRTIELVELEGPMRAGLEIQTDSHVVLHGSHFAVAGPAIVAGGRSEATVTRNVFLRAGRQAGPPVSGAVAQWTLRNNVFAGFGTDIVKGAAAAQKQQIAAANVIVSAESAAPADPAARPAARGRPFD